MDAIYPIPLRGVACACGEELEVIELRRGALDLACPRGCVVRLAPNIRYEPRTRYRAKPSVRVCARCGQIVAREPGQRGETPKYHPRCRSTEELEELAQMRRYTAQYYASHKSQWTDYADRKRARLASAASGSHPPAGLLHAE